MKKLFNMTFMVIIVFFILLTSCSNKRLNLVNYENNSILEISDDIKSIDIIFGGGDFYIKEWENLNFGFEINKGKNNNSYKYKYYVDNNVLYIDGSHKSGKSMKKGDDKVFLYIPLGKKFDKFNLTSANSDLYLENINCEKIELDMAFGKINIKNLNTSYANIVIGMGMMDIEGEILRNLKAVCSGDLNMNILGEYDKYNYLINNTLGNVKIEEYIYGKMSNKNIDNNSNKNFDLECISGNININFYDK